MRPTDPFADQKTCVKCKFYQVTDTPSPDGRVDYTIYACTQATPYVPCYENRQPGAKCGPAGTLWTSKA